jgi:hypothetical protein
MIDELIERMRALLEPLRAAADPRQYFHAVYLRTTIAVAEAIGSGGFIDPDWTERWDVAFASLYLDAIEADMSGGTPTRPWQTAFSAPRSLPPLNHVLLGMNAHINFDLPQALVMVITDEEFDAPAIMAKREEDHRAIDGVLAARVAAEDDELVSVSGPGSMLNRVLRPLNQRASQRFLRESREKVWANAVALSHARRQGPQAYAAVLGELEELSAAKVSALTAPGLVLLKLAVTGFGVRLPPAGA